MISEAEITLRQLSSTRMKVEARWLDTKNVLSLDLEIDPDTVSAGALFALVEKGRHFGDLEIAKKDSPPCTSFGADPDLKPGPLTPDDRGWKPDEDL